MTIAVASIALMGCTAAGAISTPAPQATSAIASDGLDAHSPSASYEEFPEGAGRDRFIAICSRCHSAKFVIGKRYSAPQWEEVMRQMIRHGAKIPTEDHHLILAYLSKHFD